MCSNSRIAGITNCEKLQRVLGNGYRIVFDACESGMTFCYYNNELYKRVPNSELENSGINVTNYRAPQTMIVSAW